MTRRDVLLLTSSLALPLHAAPCLSVLDPRTAADYDAYLKTARAAAELPLGPKLLDRVPEDQRAEALRVLNSNRPYVWNLHQNSPNGALPVYKGIVVDWVGAVRVPGAT